MYRSTLGSGVIKKKKKEVTEIVKPVLPKSLDGNWELRSVHKLATLGEKSICFSDKMTFSVGPRSDPIMCQSPPHSCALIGLFALSLEPSDVIGSVSKSTVALTANPYATCLIVCSTI